MKKIKRFYYQIVRWTLMILGKSQLHQAQRCNISETDKSHYPNDLSCKLFWHGHPDADQIPRNMMSDGNYFYFPIAIFQKAIAHYESYISTGCHDDYDKFNIFACWALDNQDENGGWDCWSESCKGTKTNYSAMAQGQALSVLIRYRTFNNSRRVDKALKDAYRLLQSEPLAKDYGEYILLEETPLNTLGCTTILNGHIFALWGVYEYEKIVHHEFSEFYLKSLAGTKKLLQLCDTGFWSKYDADCKIASPFYHDLHIAQLQALWIMTEDDFFLNYADRFLKYSNSKWCKFRALTIKIVQKLTEDKYNEFIS